MTAAELPLYNLPKLQGASVVKAYFTSDERQVTVSSLPAQASAHTLLQCSQRLSNSRHIRRRIIRNECSLVASRHYHLFVLRPESSERYCRDFDPRRQGGIGRME